jgi:hypothetical protein
MVGIVTPIAGIHDLKMCDPAARLRKCEPICLDANQAENAVG